MKKPGLGRLGLSQNRGADMGLNPVLCAAGRLIQVRTTGIERLAGGDIVSQCVSGVAEAVRGA